MMFKIIAFNRLFLSSFRLFIFSFFLLQFLCAQTRAADVTLALEGAYGNEFAGYKIFYKSGSPGAPYTGNGLDQGASPVSVPLGSSDPVLHKIKLTGLLENTTYYMVATAYDHAGNESTYSQEVAYTPDPPPQAPTGLQSTIPMMGPAAITAELAWNANNESDIAGYKLFSKDADGAWAMIVDAGPATGWTINDIIPGRTYCFALKAYDQSGSESPYSIENVLYTSSYEVDRDGDGVGDSFDFYPDDPTRWQELESDHANLVIETGEVQVNQEWARVVFKNKFAEPVVVAASLSLNGEQPATVRVRNIDSGGFEIRIQEWDYLDGDHAIETVGYAVMERGAYSLADGTRLEAGFFQTDKTDAFEPVLFEQSYNTAPIVMATVTSSNGSNAVVGRLRNINTEGFEYGMQEQQAHVQLHATENIAYFAWEPSSGSINGVKFEVARTPNAVTHVAQTLNFQQQFDSIPNFVAMMQTRNGGDPANIRWSNINTNSVDILVQEEQSLDLEVDHTCEVVGYMAFVSSSLLFPAIEAGKVQVNHQWIRVPLFKEFTDPIVVASSLSLNGSQPAVVRVRDIDPTGFDIRLQEWDYLDGNHVIETVGYIVMERGAYSLADGTRLEAGSFQTNKTDAFEPVLFEQPYNAAPIVIATVTSINESDTVAGRLRNVSTEAFDYGLQEQQANAQIHATENISYIAWEPSSGNINGLKFEVNRTSNVVTDAVHTLKFQQQFGAIPVFVAMMQTYHGSDPANVRWKNMTTASVDILVHEEQSLDDEVDHTSEVVGYILIE